MLDAGQTSVVREIRMLRSVGAGERATAPGHPVVSRELYPYRDRQLTALTERLAEHLAYAIRYPDLPEDDSTKGPASRDQKEEGRR